MIVTLRWKRYGQIIYDITNQIFFSCNKEVRVEQTATYGIRTLELIARSASQELVWAHNFVNMASMRSSNKAWWSSNHVHFEKQEADLLSNCRSRVQESGCEVMPSWANGAMLLVPLTVDQGREAQFCLRAHNIVALESDRDMIIVGFSASAQFLVKLTSSW